MRAASMGRRDQHMGEKCPYHLCIAGVHEAKGGDRKKAMHMFQSALLLLEEKERPKYALPEESERIQSYDEGTDPFRSYLCPNGIPASGILVSTILYNMGRLLIETSSHCQATEILEEALGRIGDPSSSAHLSSYIYLALAGCYHILGWFGHAQNVMEESIRIGVFDHDLAFKAAAYNLLGVVYFKKNESHGQKAMASLRVSMKLYLRLGNCEKKLATVFNNIGRVHYRDQKFSEAQEMFERAYFSRIGLYGNEHRDVAATLLCLAKTYRQQRLYESAFEAFTEYIRSCSGPRELVDPALFMCFGERDGPFTATILSLGYSEYARKRYFTALKCFKVALDIECENFGMVQRGVSSIIFSIGRTLAAMQEYKASIASFQEILRIESILTEGFPNEKAVCIMLEIASVREAMGDETGALADLIGILRIQESLSMRRENYFFTSTCATMGKIASIYERMGNLETAQHYLSRVLRIQRQSPYHGDSALTVFRLASLNLQLGWIKEVLGNLLELERLLEKRGGSIVGTELSGMHLYMISKLLPISAAAA